MGVKLNRLYNPLYLFILILLCVTAIQASGWVTLPAFANAFYENYTTALDDLSSDANFNAEKYVDDAGDYSLQVIQIAESTDGELFVYTYQPCQKTRYLIATSLNMSLSENVAGTKLYNLSLLNVSGVFCKYLVQGVSVELKNPHYYNITSIFRAWDKEIDEPTGNDNTINEVVYDVGQLWTVTTDSSGVHYACDGTERITVTDKYCGYFRYYDGYKLYKSACDSHYIAFSTDYYIQTLLEAEVAFVTQDYTCNITSIQNPPDMGGGSTSFYDYDYADPVPRQVTVTSDQQGSNDGDGLFGVKYLWDRIEKVSDFLNSEKDNLTEAARTQIQGKQWILRFVDLPYTLTPHLGGSEEKGTKVTKETILRLEFETNGERFNLGVVDNKQTGGNKPSNNPHAPNFWDWFANWLGVPVWAAKLILALIVLLIGGPIILLILSIFFPVLRGVLSGAVKCIWSVITSPFRFIAWIIRKVKGD